MPTIGPNTTGELPRGATPPGPVAPPPAAPPPVLPFDPGPMPKGIDDAPPVTPSGPPPGPEFSQPAPAPAAPDNPYLTMPLKVVQEHAAQGVLAAKAALKARAGESAPAPAAAAPAPPLPEPQIPTAPKSPEGWGSANTIITANAKQAALDRLRKKMGGSQLQSGFTPEDFQDALTVAGFHLEAGARGLADFSARMVGDLGEAIRPHLAALHAAASERFLAPRTAPKPQEQPPAATEDPLATAPVGGKVDQSATLPVGAKPTSAFDAPQTREFATEGTAPDATPPKIPWDTSSPEALTDAKRYKTTFVEVPTEQLLRLAQEDIHGEAGRARPEKLRGAHVFLRKARKEGIPVHTPEATVVNGKVVIEGYHRLQAAYDQGALTVPIGVSLAKLDALRASGLEMRPVAGHELPPYTEGRETTNAATTASPAGIGSADAGGLSPSDAGSGRGNGEAGDGRVVAGVQGSASGGEPGSLGPTQRGPVAPPVRGTAEGGVVGAIPAPSDASRSVAPPPVPASFQKAVDVRNGATFHEPTDADIERIRAESPHRYGPGVQAAVDAMTPIERASFERAGYAARWHAQQPEAGHRERAQEIENELNAKVAEAKPGDGAPASFPRDTSPRYAADHDVVRVPLADINVDPQRFQFKLDTNEKGASEKLKGVRQWNDDAAGIVYVWRDPADGKVYAVNGHHRVDLAQRLNRPDLRAKFIDLPTAAEARAEGAMQNLREGQGTEFDAAKLMRDSGMTPKNLEDAGVALNDQRMKKAIGLANLREDFFNAAINGRAPVEWFAMVGEHVPDQSQQQAVFEAIEKSPPRNASELLQRIRQYNAATEEQSSLFGAGEMNHLINERASVVSKLLSELKTDARVMRSLADAAQAKRVEAETGSTINAEAAGKKSTELKDVSGVLNDLAYRGGPIGSAITKAAQRLANGESLNDVIQSVLPEVRQAAIEAMGANPHAEVKGDSGGEAAGGFSEDAPSLFDDPPDVPPAPPAGDVGPPETKASVAKAKYAYNIGDGKTVETNLSPDDLREIQDIIVKRTGVSRDQVDFVPEITPQDVGEKGLAAHGFDENSKGIGTRGLTVMGTMRGPDGDIRAHAVVMLAMRLFGQVVSKADISKTAAHEAFHIVMDTLLKPHEREALYKFGEEQWPRKAGESVEDHQARMDENLADMLSEEPAPQMGPVRRAIAVVRDVLARVASYLRSKGFKNLADIFPGADPLYIARGIEEGRYKSRMPGGRVAARVQAAARRAMVAWHGSPYDFDKFDSSKIGTGEGVQVFGHGLYFAGDEAVARYYKEALSRPEVKLLSLDGGTPLKVGDFDIAITRALQEPSSISREAASAIERADGDVAQAVEDVRDRAFEQSLWARDNPTSPDVEIAREQATHYRRVYRALERLVGRVKMSKTGGEGRLYKVDLAPKDDEWLDWDKPLSQQSDKVLDGLDKLIPGQKRIVEIDRAMDEIASRPAARHSENPAWTKEWDALDAERRELLSREDTMPAHTRGEKAYKAIGDRRPRYAGDKFPEWMRGEKLGGDDVYASKALREAGVPGIRFLDGSSRSKGEGHHNYVVFDDKLVNIESKASVAKKPPDDEKPADSPDITSAEDTFLGRTPKEPRQPDLFTKDAATEAVKQGKLATDRTDEPPPPPPKPGMLASAGGFARAVGKQLAAPTKYDMWAKAKNYLSARAQRTGEEGKALIEQAKRVMPDKGKRAGVSAYIEAQRVADESGRTVASVLNEWAAKSSPEHAKDYKAAAAFTPEEIAFVSKVEQFYHDKLTLAKKWGVVDEGLEGYVNRAWKRRGGEAPSSLMGGRMKASASLQKERYHATRFAGEQAGLAHETKDIGELMAVYSAELNKVIAHKEFIANLSKAVARDGRPAVAPMGKFETVKNDDGSGVYLSYPEATAKTVSGDGELQSTADYKPIDNPHLLREWKWVGNDEDGNPVIQHGALAIHPQFRTDVNNITRGSAIAKWARQSMAESSAVGQIPRGAYRGVKATHDLMKELIFSFSGFHYGSLWFRGVAQRVGTKATVEALKSAANVTSQIHPAIHQMVKDALNIKAPDYNDPKTVKWMQHGLALFSDNTPTSSFMEGTGGVFKFRKVPVLGHIAGTISDDLFHRYIPSLKLKIADALLARNMDTFKEELANGSYTPDDVQYITARQANAAASHINRIDIIRNPTFQEFLSLAVMAPDFTETHIRQVGQALKPSMKEGMAPRMSIAMGGGLLYGVARVLNQMLDDDPHWEPKNAFAVIYNGRRYSIRSLEGDILHAIEDWNGFVQGRVSPLGRYAVEKYTGRNYRGEEIDGGEAEKELATSFVPIVARGLPGLRNLNQTQKMADVPPMEQFMGAMGIHASRDSPINNLYPLADKYKKDVLGDKKHKGVYDPSPYQQLRYALEDGDMERAAEEYAKLTKNADPRDVAKGFHASVRKPFTGTLEHDKQFEASLDEKGKALYKAAQETRDKIMARFETVSGTPEHHARPRRQRNTFTPPPPQ